MFTTSELTFSNLLQFVYIFIEYLKPHFQIHFSTLQRAILSQEVTFIVCETWMFTQKPRTCFPCRTHLAVQNLRA